jgi:eukaryotic-like serine/threonine-protein kinase
MSAVASDPTGGPARTPAQKPARKPTRNVGRYALFDEIGRGGTATVHLGRLLGPIGFSKTVAIKRMNESLARDPDVAAMFLDEARLASRIQHSNVVATFDALAVDGEAFLVMEYVHGESLASLLRTLRARHQAVPAPVAVQIVRDALHGLHAAHEARNELGEPLDLVHRDVSPHNILVGIDGISRVFDFGIAKAVGRWQDTHTGQLKGKVSYMSPEQLLGRPLDRRVDVFAAALVLWEALVGRKPFDGESEGRVMFQLVEQPAPPLTSVLPDLPSSLAAVVAKAAALDPAQRFATALEFARALEQESQPLPPSVIGDWVRDVAGATLARRDESLRTMEACSVGSWSEEVEVLTAAQRASSAPVLIPADADAETKSEITGLLDSGLREVPRSARRRRGRVAVGVGVAVALCAGAVFALGRGKASPATAPVERVVQSEALPAGSAPGVLAPVAASSAPPSIQATSPAPATADPTPATGAKTSRPRRVLTKHAPPAPAPGMRRPEDLFSRE